MYKNGERGVFLIDIFVNVIVGVYSIIYYGYILFLFFNDKCKRIYKYFFKVKLNLI